MQALLRETVFGHAVNRLSKGKLLPFPEERSDFVVPARFLRDDKTQAPSQTLQEKAGQKPSVAPSPTRTLTPDDSCQTTRCSSPVSGTTPLDQAHHRDSDARTLTDAHAERIIERETHLNSNADKAQKKVEDGEDRFLVGWYGDDDPDNPQNWPSWKKTLLLVGMQLLTFSMYIGSAIYTPSIPGVMEAFNVSQTKATLGLSLYVLAYGIGPMVLSPLSEIPSFGRLNVYMISLFIFMILQIPTALAPNYSTLMAMRFLAGFVCSPALSTGGATLADVYSPMSYPYVVAGWAAGAVAGPVAGPVAGGFAAMNENWRWPLYMLLFISVFCFFFLFFFFPETSAANILLKRAQRLRKLTGNDKLRSRSEIEQAELSANEIIVRSLWRPFRLLLEPAVAFIDLYIALVYAIFYLWFEAFPIVFGPEGYNFNLGEQGLPFVGFIVALVPTLAAYFAYQKYSIIPKFLRDGTLIPEERLKVAIVGASIIPAALFIFGWTAQEKTHWFWPIFGASLYLPGIYLCFQGAIIYIAMAYPEYAASILAGNALMRGATGAGFPLFGHAMFNKLTIGGGSSLLAGLSIVMIPPIWFLWKYGSKLRAMSKFASE